MTYLDYNATAPLLPEVKTAMLSAFDMPLNPSSIHAEGRKARKFVEEARRQILKSVNADNLIFCGSGTEANNLALSQSIEHRAQGIVVSAIEHDSIYKFPHQAEINVNADGVVDLSHLEKTLSSMPYALCSIMLANNETGVIQPVKEAAAIAHKYNTLIHCDAVQAYGKIAVDFKDLDVDMMTISAHKVGGPIGVSVLLYKPQLDIKPISFGGGQEKNKRPGTENVAAIIGLGELAKNVSRGTSADLRDYLESQIKKISLEAIIFGENSPRLPNTSCIAMPDMVSSTQLIHFDSNGISVSAGSACSSGKVEVSRVLKAMGVNMAANAIRISTGWATTHEDIDKFIKSWRELYLRSTKAA